LQGRYSPHVTDPAAGLIARLLSGDLTVADLTDDQLPDVLRTLYSARTLEKQLVAALHASGGGWTWQRIADLLAESGRRVSPPTVHRWASQSQSES
jgi:hypothetical protein